MTMGIVPGADSPMLKRKSQHRWGKANVDQCRCRPGQLRDKRKCGLVPIVEEYSEMYRKPSMA